MVTAKDVEQRQPGSILAEGLCPQRGQVMRYVAIRGGACDWAVYVGPQDWTREQVQQNGDKVFPESREFPVRASKDAVALYRY